MFVGMMMQGCR